MKPIEDYIGDGVYVTFDGYAVELDLRAQNPGISIYLEPEVLRNLIKFSERCGMKV